MPGRGVAGTERAVVIDSPPSAVAIPRGEPRREDDRPWDKPPCEPCCKSGVAVPETLPRTLGTLERSPSAGESVMVGFVTVRR